MTGSFTELPCWRHSAPFFENGGLDFICSRRRIRSHRQGRASRGSVDREIAVTSLALVALRHWTRAGLLVQREFVGRGAVGDDAGSRPDNDLS